MVFDGAGLSHPGPGPEWRPVPMVGNKLCRARHFGCHRAARRKWLQSKNTKVRRSFTALFLQSQASAVFGLDIHPAATIRKGQPAPLQVDDLREQLDDLKNENEELIERLERLEALGADAGE